MNNQLPLFYMNDFKKKKDSFQQVLDFDLDGLYILL